MTPRREAGDRPSATDEALIDALAQSAFVVMGVLTHVGAEHDLSLTQMRVLGILRDRRLRMAALADYLGLEKSTLSGLVERAERRGLLERAKSEEDGRVVEVFMTAAGRRKAARVHAEVSAALASTTRSFGAQDRDTLRKLLTRMLEPGLETAIGAP
jgi:DNA-binding MarR family transcriptional regulator